MIFKITGSLLLVSCLMFCASPEQSGEDNAASSEETGEEKPSEEEQTKSEEKGEKDEPDGQNELVYELPSYDPLKNGTESEVSFLDASEEDKESINNCLRNIKSDKINLDEFDTDIGNFTFKKVEFPSIRGEFAIMYKDEEASENRKITLINAIATTGSNLHLSLKNPKGLYCIKNVDRIGSEYTFHMDCHSLLSEYQSWQEVEYGHSELQETGIYVGKDFMIRTYIPEDSSSCLRTRDHDS